MITGDLREKLEKLVRTVTDGLHLELVDLDWVTENEQNIFRVTIDRENGVTIDDCSKVSRKLSLILDVEDPFLVPYHLEVSSPGIFRPLKTEEHFLRYIGHRIRVTVTEAGNKKKLTGTLLEVKQKNIVVKVGDTVQEVMLDHISKAILYPELPGEQGRKKASRGKDPAGTV